MATDRTFFLQREYKATIVLDAFAAGYYSIKNPGVEPTGYTELSAGETYTIGPANVDNNYLLHLDSGDATITIEFAGQDIEDITQAPNITADDEDAVYTLSPNDGASHQITFTENVELAFNFRPGEVKSMLLVLIDGGGVTITWPDTMLWAGGTEPTLTASGTDLVTIIQDGNNNVYGAVVGLDMQVAS